MPKRESYLILIPSAAESVAVGDLDGDGDLDIVSGDDDGDVIAWENDGTPFTGLWMTHTVGTVGGIDIEVESVAVGDLDGDDDLDIVSGDSYSDVIAWENGGGLFPVTWTRRDVGTADHEVASVAVGDLDGDGDLDIVSGDEDEDDVTGDVIAWESGGGLFPIIWTRRDVGTADAPVASVAVGDLDGDCGLDIVSGDGDEGEEIDAGDVIAWENTYTCPPVGGTTEPASLLAWPWVALAAAVGLGSAGVVAALRKRSAIEPLNR